ncbi:hypothetical protein ACOME3_001703 [Neoechinorhynchus agilis]
MAYDMHGAWERTVGFNAPLKSSLNTSSPFHDWSVNSAIKYWINDQHFPRERINLGLALYGRTFTLQSPNDLRPYYGRNRGPGIAGPGTREPGVLSFVEIWKKYLPDQKHPRWFDLERFVPYITDGNEWVTFDDAESLLLKVNFAKCYDLGGLMFWALDYDDFNGQCGISVNNDKKFPLIRACRHLFEHPLNVDVCRIVI